jgi:hypothetical protein
MGRVTPNGPRVVDGQLVGVAGGPVAVGSAAWHAFSAEPSVTTRAFTFPAACKFQNYLRRNLRGYLSPVAVIALL